MLFLSRRHPQTGRFIRNKQETIEILFERTPFSLNLYFIIIIIIIDWGEAKK
jgi:hypothetical protein